MKKEKGFFLANDFYLIYSTNNTSHLWYICRKTNTEGKSQENHTQIPWQLATTTKKLLYHHFGKIFIKGRERYISFRVLYIGFHKY